MTLLTKIRNACAETGECYKGGPKYWMRNKHKERLMVRGIRLYFLWLTAKL